jgi:hypothetical protein
LHGAEQRPHPYRCSRPLGPLYRPEGCPACRGLAQWKGAGWNAGGHLCGFAKGRLAAPCSSYLLEGILARQAGILERLVCQSRLTDDPTAAPDGPVKPPAHAGTRLNVDCEWV